MGYEESWRRSVDEPEAFWGEQARLIDWRTPPQRILDQANPPFRRWFVGGTTNLCHNAIDRHLAARGDQLAIVAVSTETATTREITYRELHAEVNAFAGVLTDLGVGKGERVVIYLPNIAEAVFAMLACARIGAIHSVVFGGFAAHNLALRIDDAEPKLLICADAGMRAGKVIPYKPLVDAALREATAPPPHVLVVNRGLDPDMAWVDGRDVDYATRRAGRLGTAVPVVWLESNEPSYLLYTSGTTGKPKGVQRDVGGYAVALALSMTSIFDLQPGQTILCTSDVGWAVGHSYNVYGPLIGGCTAILYEGTPILPDPGIWWKLCEQYGVRTMFSSPTGIRMLKKQDASWLGKYDLSALRWIFLAGEPLDQPTYEWLTGGTGKAVIDNYWQTETGWPALSLMPGLDMKRVKPGSPGFPTFGYRMRVIDDATGDDKPAGEKGVLVIEPPLPPGCLTTIWRDDERYKRSYFGHFKELLYSSLDWAVRDADGYTFILGRTDDVINVAGHRLGTREIEESVATLGAVAEVAVVGVADELKGQLPAVFATLKQGVTDHPEDVAKAMERRVVELLGALARPGCVYVVGALPKTRSGKLLRRSLQALMQGTDPGDLSTLDDPNALEEIRRAIARGPDCGRRLG
ncbi:propionate--CoA ligase [Luteibacter aegosomatissinici]|uniref:propionate--CoA ligase n=1 Tax=Luteibacter aegosomatissinici TaxID=2911539 RepID=UPI001FFAD6E8|nr:propionate--CoA ligase [Luteibacter aegosomatissinici]UPG95533.1 propionate--CoA ligase [Luteibacter aegosomatissinici]